MAAPILAAIEGAGLHDVVVLVSRYRLGEGAKLGTGGLVRAYGGTAAAALAAAERIDIVPTARLRVTYDVADTGLVFGALSAFSPRSAHEPSDGEQQLVLECDVPPDDVARLSSKLKDATKGRALIEER